MITAKEAREIAIGETRYLWQLESIIEQAAKQGRRRISFYFLNEDRIKSLKDKGFDIDMEKRTISW